MKENFYKGMRVEGEKFSNILNREMRLEREKPLGFSSSKGYIYTLEALVIITLILISISVMFSVPSQRPELEISNIKQQGFEALEYMDKYGDLRRVALSSNEAELKSLLSTLLSKNLAYEVNICKSNCSSASVAGNETVVAVKYYIADYRNVYTGKKVILWMWRKI